MLKQDEIIDMAKQSGLLDMDYELGDWEIHEFTTFAKLVAKAAKEQEYADLIRIIEANVAAEREACAKVCDDYIVKWQRAGFRGDLTTASECADAIRARGQT